MKTRSHKKISKTQKMVSEDILVVHSIAFSLWGTTSKLASLPFTGAPKCITISHLPPLSQAGSCTPSQAGCPLTCSLEPRACPQHAGSQGCPPLVPVFHIPESSSEGGAHEGFPSGAPGGREGCKGQALCWADGLGKCASPDVPFASLSSFPLPFPQSLVFAASMRRARALSLLLPWCSLLWPETPGTWLSLEPGWSLGGTSRPWETEVGKERERRGPRCCPAEGP